MKYFRIIKRSLFIYVLAHIYVLTGCSSGYFTADERKEETKTKEQQITNNQRNEKETIPQAISADPSFKFQIYPLLARMPDGKSNHQVVLCYSGIEDLFTNEDYSLNINIDGNIQKLASAFAEKERKKRLETSTISLRVKNYIVTAKYNVPDILIRKLADAKKITILPITTSPKEIALSGLEILAFRQYAEQNIKDNLYEASTDKALNINPEIYNDSAPITVDALARLGFLLSELSESGKQLFSVENGVYISRINQDSDADKQGFKKGTVITNIGSRDILNINEMIEIMNTKRGQTLNLTLKNIDGEVVFLRLKLP